ncbi:MAG: DMT family transporter [Candidatus Latescibacterota bacterium]
MRAPLSAAEAAGIGCAVLWAFNALVLRTQSERLSPAVMTALRCATAGLLFWCLLPFDAPLSGLRRIPAREWGLLAASVTVGIGIGDVFYLIAIREIGLSRSLALSGVFPLTTMLWELLLLDLSLRPSLVAGTCLVVAGVVLLSLRTPHPGTGSGATPSRFGLGVALSLAAAGLWGLSSVLLKPAIAHMTLVQANAVRMPLVALLLYLLRILPSRQERQRALPLRNAAIVAATGVLGMGAGAWLFLYSLSHAGPTKAVTLASTSPVFGMGLALLFLGERITPRSAAGTGCCLAGVWVVV